MASSKLSVFRCFPPKKFAPNSCATSFFESSSSPCFFLMMSTWNCFQRRAFCRRPKRLYVVCASSLSSNRTLFHRQVDWKFLSPFTGYSGQQVGLLGWLTSLKELKVTWLLSSLSSEHFRFKMQAPFIPHCFSNKASPWNRHLSIWKLWHSRASVPWQELQKFISFLVGQVETAVIAVANEENTLHMTFISVQFTCVKSFYEFNEFTFLLRFL